MKNRFIPYADEISVGSLRKGFKIVLRKPYDAALQEYLQTPASYSRLIEKEGVSLKMEARTEIRLWNLGDRELFFKHYLYPGISRMKTLLSRMPKAQREYLALGFMEFLGIPCVEAVGWGAEWTRMGGVRRCFILTVKEKNTLDFRAWLKEMETASGFRNRAMVILQKLAGFFRSMHARGFFLLRPNTRNVLIHPPDAPDPGVLFLDQPYARFLSGPGARWGQLQDLSTLLGGALRHLDEGIIDDFLDVYLPDPLRGSPEALRHRLMLALKARESENRVEKLTLRFRSLLPVFLDKSRKKR